tara:strand:- start:24 stop:875 length:852 start_codon:yes stop_codon:yes gene_type:complete
MGFKSNIIDSTFYINHFSKISKNNQANKKQKTDVFFLIDFDYAFANNDLEAYRLKTGYAQKSLQNRINFSKDFLKILVKDILNFARNNPSINIEIGRYPNTNIEEVYEYFEPYIRLDHINISFNFELDIQKSILDCDLLITNNLDMAINKNINEGYSAIYRPLQAPEELKDINNYHLCIVNHLDLKMDEIIFESSKNIFLIEKENFSNDTLTIAINTLIALDKSYNLTNRFKLISLDRLQIFKYNFKELLKLLIKSKFSYKNTISNYFIPFTLNNHKAKKYKR